MKQINQLQYLIFTYFIISVVIILTSSIWLSFNIYITIFVFLIVFLLIIFIFQRFKKIYNEKNDYIINSNVKNTNKAIVYAEIGIIIYNDEFEIEYQSDYFDNLKFNFRGLKLLNEFPEISKIINENNSSVIVELENKYYEVIKDSDTKTLIFKDISEIYHLKNKFNKQQIVIGYLCFDNYDEFYNFNEEEIFTFNTLQHNVYEYLKEKNVLFKQIKANLLLLMMNENSYNEILNDKFSILNTIRRKSQNEDLHLTISMAISRGSDSLFELDELAKELLEICQSRGGDQVIIKKIGEDIKYFGGNSEAKEKNSKIKARISSLAVKDLIVKSSNVFIAGHKNADADCVGSSIIMSLIASSYGKEVYIINKTGGIEATINNVLTIYDDELIENHNFISQNEALNHLDENSLLIMLDHHSKEISGASEVVEKCKKIAVIDHHRRKLDLDIEPIFAYIEPSSSSTVELVMEFIPYINKRLKLNEIEANIAYMGILIDTNRFRKRTGARTYEVMSSLRKFGADPYECDKLMEVPFDDLILKSKIINNSTKYKDDIIIVKNNENDVFSRSLISQACDEIVQSNGIEVVFILAKTSDNEVTISARSKDSFNVQVVMEKMNGGGHMSAAGLQRKNTTINDLYYELIEKIEEYLKGE